MKNFLFFFILSFVFVTNSFSKILDFQSHKIDVPNKFYQLDWSDYDFMSEECSYYNICYGIVDKKLLEVFLLEEKILRIQIYLCLFLK